VVKKSKKRYEVVYMKIMKKQEIIDFLEILFYKVYGAEECRICREKIRCRSGQFIKKKEKVQCTACKRYLETVKEK